MNTEGHVSHTMPSSKNLQTVNPGENVEKREPSSCWWECKLITRLGRTVWRFLKELKIELPYDPAIPLLGMYPGKTTVSNDTWSDALNPCLIYVNFPYLRNQSFTLCPHGEDPEAGLPPRRMQVCTTAFPWVPDAISHVLSCLSPSIAQRHRGRMNNKLKHVNIL